MTRLPKSSGVLWFRGDGRDRVVQVCGGKSGEAAGVARMWLHGAGRDHLLKLAGAAGDAGDVVRHMATLDVGPLAAAGVPAAEWNYDAAVDARRLVAALRNANVPWPLAVHRAAAAYAAPYAGLGGYVSRMSEKAVPPQVVDDEGLRAVVDHSSRCTQGAGGEKVSKEWITVEGAQRWVNRDEDGQFAEVKQGGKNVRVRRKRNVEEKKVEAEAEAERPVELSAEQLAAVRRNSGLAALAARQKKEKAKKAEKKAAVKRRRERRVAAEAAAAKEAASAKNVGAVTRTAAKVATARQKVAAARQKVATGVSAKVKAAAHKRVKVARDQLKVKRAITRVDIEQTGDDVAWASNFWDREPFSYQRMFDTLITGGNDGLSMDSHGTKRTLSVLGPALLYRLLEKEGEHPRGVNGIGFSAVRETANKYLGSGVSRGVLGSDEGAIEDAAERLLSSDASATIHARQSYGYTKSKNDDDTSPEVTENVSDIVRSLLDEDSVKFEVPAFLVARAVNSTKDESRAPNSRRGVRLSTEAMADALERFGLIPDVRADLVLNKETPYINDLAGSRPPTSRKFMERVNAEDPGDGNESWALGKSITALDHLLRETGGSRPRVRTNSPLAVKRYYSADAAEWAANAMRFDAKPHVTDSEVLDYLDTLSDVDIRAHGSETFYVPTIALYSTNVPVWTDRTVPGFVSWGLGGNPEGYRVKPVGSGGVKSEQIEQDGGVREPEVTALSGAVDALRRWMQIYQGTYGGGDAKSNKVWAEPIAWRKADVGGFVDEPVKLGLGTDGAHDWEQLEPGVGQRFTQLSDFVMRLGQAKASAAPDGAAFQAQMTALASLSSERTAEFEDRIKGAAGGLAHESPPAKTDKHGRPILTFTDILTSNVAEYAIEAVLQDYGQSFEDFVTALQAEDPVMMANAFDNALATYVEEIAAVAEEEGEGAQLLFEQQYYSAESAETWEKLFDSFTSEDWQLARSYMASKELASRYFDTRPEYEPMEHSNVDEQEEQVFMHSTDALTEHTPLLLPLDVLKELRHVDGAVQPNSALDDLRLWESSPTWYNQSSSMLEQSKKVLGWVPGLENPLD